MLFICIFYPFDTVRGKVKFKYLNHKNSGTMEMENERGKNHSPNKTIVEID